MKLAYRLHVKRHNYNNYIKAGGPLAQAVSRWPPTVMGTSSRLGHSMWVSWWTRGIWIGFYRGFSRLPLPQISFHHFSTLISIILLHFISPYGGVSGVIGRHPCYSLSSNIGDSQHFIPPPGPVSNISRAQINAYRILKKIKPLLLKSTAIKIWWALVIS